MKSFIVILLTICCSISYSQIRIKNAVVIIKDSYLILKDGTSNTVSSNGGGILTKTSNSFVNIGATGGLYTYTIPFVATNSDTIPVRFQVTNVTSGSSISFNSYEVGNDNTPLPTTSYVGGASSDTALHGIDRFWKIVPYGFTTFPQSQVTFSYSALDTIGNNLVESELQVKRFNSTLSDWNDKTYAVVVTDRKVTVPLTSSSDFFNVWNLYYSPSLLPLEFISFSTRCNDNGTTLEWKTAEEVDVKEYIIESSKDAINWNYVSTIPAQNRQINSYDLNINSSGYFRLIAVDIDGTKDILELSYSNCKTKELDWVLEGDIIKFNTTIDRLSIYNALGEVISYDYDIDQIQLPDTKQIFIIVANVDGAFHSFKISKHE